MMKFRNWEGFWNKLLEEFHFLKIKIGRMFCLIGERAGFGKSKIEGGDRRPHERDKIDEAKYAKPLKSYEDIYIDDVLIIFDRLLILTRKDLPFFI